MERYGSCTAAYDGEFGDYLADIMDEKGMKKIGYVEWGFRHITNNKKPIVKPEDMEGLKIRLHNLNFASMHSKS